MANTLKFGAGEWATKKGSTLAYNDENGNFKPLPFTFDRSTSATRVNKEGLIEVVSNNEPRIDFLNDSKGALLLEPQSTNLYTYSNDVSFWTKSNVITTSDYAISPDGTQNAFRAVFSSSTGLLYITATGTTGTNNTLSVWAKSNNGSSNKFRFFANGVTTLSNDFIATDEWQRFEFTFNCTSVTSGLTGASDSATNDILFYGFQHEAGSYPTSYIPTQGSIGTRVAESCSQTPPSGIIGQTEGTVYCEVNISNTTFKTIFALDTGSPSNFIVLDASSGLSPRILVRQSSGSFPAIITGTAMSYGINKIAFCYKSGDYAMYVNGVLSGTSASTTFPSGIISKISVGANPSYGYLSDAINDLKLYNTRLSNAELQALTS